MEYGPHSQNLGHKAGGGGAKEEKEEKEEEEEEKEEEGAQYIYNSPNSLLPIHKLCQT